MGLAATDNVPCNQVKADAPLSRQARALPATMELTQLTNAPAVGAQSGHLLAK